MMKKLIKRVLPLMFVMLFFCSVSFAAEAAEIEDSAQQTEETAAESSPLGFEIANFFYEIVEEATQEDMPVGFTIADWEYHGVAVKAGFTKNSDMVCVMGKDLENGNQYRFIYDPNHELFVPYFGTEIKNGYVYTIPVYEGAEVPYGFVDAYFVFQTVPMFCYMREDAELTQEEIAVGSLSEDNYLVLLMMNEEGEEVHYTYDLIDRTYQRSLLQKVDAEKVTELNETIDKLSEDIGTLNAINAERMNQRLMIIGGLIAAVIVMAGVIVNLLLKIGKLKNLSEDWEEEAEEEENAENANTTEPVKAEESSEAETEEDDDDDMEIIDLDLEDE